MRQDGDKMDIVISSMVILIVGAVILCSAVIPIVSDQVESLGNLAGEGQILDISTYQTLIGVAILMAIIGLVIGIIKMYSGRSDR